MKINSVSKEIILRIWPFAIRVTYLICAASVCALSACTTGGFFSPYARLEPDTDTATSSGNASKAACTAATRNPVKTLVLPTDAHAAELVKNFDAVRHEAGITKVAVDLKLDSFVSLSEFVNEVQRLRDGKRAAAGPKNAVSPAGGAPAAAVGTSNPPLDAVERVLIDKLPNWAGDSNVTMPALDATIKAAGETAASDVVAAAASGTQATTPLPGNAALAVSAGVTLLSLGAGKAAPLNALLPPEAKAPEEATRNAGAATFDRSDHKSLFQNLQTLQVLRAFHFMTLASAVRLHTMARSGASDGDIQTEIRIFNWSRFLSTYFDAYFRGGHFLQVTVNEDKIKSLASTGFVTRSGMSVQFSGIDYALTIGQSGVSLHHTYPQVSQFGPQLVRVFVEAVFDANGLSPMAVSNSTACTEGLFTADECISSDGKDKADEDATQQIDMLASASESLTTAATGAIIRGVNVVALNNETVAQVLETFAGVNARKITEKLVYLTATKNGTAGACPARAVTASLKVK